MKNKDCVIFFSKFQLSLVLSLSQVQLCDPMDCSTPGSSVHGIFQARALEWVPLPSPIHMHICIHECILHDIHLKGSRCYYRIITEEDALQIESSKMTSLSGWHLSTDRLQLHEKQERSPLQALGNSEHPRQELLMVLSHWKKIILV